MYAFLTTDDIILASALITNESDLKKRYFWKKTQLYGRHR